MKKSIRAVARLIAAASAVAGLGLPGTFSAPRARALTALQLRQLQRSIDRLCRENAALKERIEQMEWER